ncbi:WG repeat-containing protein [Coleofasciculus sp. H7-2]|uniref:WG repeat-containing protein n=1 Tax=Coleofasciculus sp. H7-2 TaxID=3351545 RepID=UPI00366A5F7B
MSGLLNCSRTQQELRSPILSLGPESGSVESFSNELAKVTVGSKYGYIDHKGRMVSQSQFDEALIE